MAPLGFSPISPMDKTSLALSGPEAETMPRDQRCSMLFSKYYDKFSWKINFLALLCVFRNSLRVPPSGLGGLSASYPTVETILEQNRRELLVLCCPFLGDSTVYTDEEIISLVQSKPQDGSDLEETDEPENVLASHSEAANALETALRYVEQSENATSTNIMFLRRWHNIVSASRITSLRQTNLTNFFTPKDLKCVCDVLM
ncbi:hypothetical protein AVEN_193256-1 [Araneus ventricosus]|uniref:Uncharacterized protein n=1 Tax=Araneus ventricosus TaxID=182803 RepID=A0A4Y2HMZ2_ARAVE|nr:hypothetical protein AVEN_193256-1 [Araneus ventricosus]